MSDQTSIKIFIDESADKVELFKSLGKIVINKSELFKYAIWMWEVPKHIVESDFDYLQSKVPGLEALLSDHINLTKISIENLSNDDRVKKIASEAVGVGVGLKFTVDLLNTNPNKFKKIPPATEGKYLDYSTIHELKEYEIETKGTVSNYYTTFKNDILNKKKNASKDVHLRFGTITQMKAPGSGEESQCIIVDDPPVEIQAENDDTLKTQLYGYGTFLSYILDSKYYNKYIKPLKNNRIRSVKINNEKFFGIYSFAGNDYYGECFDRRLIKENFIELKINSNKPKEVFNELSEKVGKIKLFIGLDKNVIDAINNKDEEFLSKYSSERIFQTNEGGSIFLDKDGIIIVKSINGHDKQLEKIFTEDEVFKRLNLYSDYTKGIAHECGAPCRSRYIEGKPCEIMTYRTYCHFHR